MDKINSIIETNQIINVTGIQKGNVSEVVYHLLEVARHCLLVNNWEDTYIIVKAIDRVAESNSTLAEEIQSAWEKISGLVTIY